MAERRFHPAPRVSRPGTPPSSPWAAGRRSFPLAAHADAIRFTDAGRVRALEPGLRATLQEAIGYADAGLRPPQEASALELPVELSEALGADPELAAAFHAFTPGRKKSYVLHLRSAKKPATRVARLLRKRDHILAGKGATER
ncbi:MAG: YdeI/OmpD-associated family protein [Myxococcota bacterium]